MMEKRTDNTRRSIRGKVISLAAIILISLTAVTAAAILYTQDSFNTVYEYHNKHFGNTYGSMLYEYTSLILSVVFPVFIPFQMLFAYIRFKSVFITAMASLIYLPVAIAMNYGYLYVNLAFSLLEGAVFILFDIACKAAAEKWLPRLHKGITTLIKIGVLYAAYWPAVIASFFIFLKTFYADKMGVYMRDEFIVTDIYTHAVPVMLVLLFALTLFSRSPRKYP